ncbi:hypothetical protein [Halobacillus naozhouensis]|uniref:Uncharacterized protein n=1 Tax=Halobacillus naozhouensis TaxID=554880 RepID=A0ABY8J196_9BACI|nr:hypothetical protein [Halobacillus naozhouensis]WFT76273.1 hypothetical protein P9989_07885 [Halobacillus naozhouensis]
MNRKTKSIIGLIGSLIVCLFGSYRLVVEAPYTESLLIVPIAFAVTGFIGIIGNAGNLKKINNNSH